MYKSLNNIYSFLEIKDNQDFSCPFVNGYCRNILHCDSEGTLKTYIPLIHKFWIYSLYFPPKKEQSFPDYMWEYRTTIATKGYQIEKKDTVYGINIKYFSKEFKPTNSVNIDMTALKSYFNYIFDELCNENFELVDKIPYGAYGDALNYDKLTNSENHSKGSSYGLKARGMMRDALANNITIFDKLIKSKKHTKKENSLNKGLGRSVLDTTTISMKNFPLVMFDDFIGRINNPKDKLLYLLCGCLGARRSQALNLTFYDVDVKNEKVYLTDPLTNLKPTDSNGKVFMAQLGRKDLLAKYKIFANIKPHSLIRFKYQIPTMSESSRELMFLPGKYKKIFFETYSRVLQTIDTRKNPFIFQTKNKRRYLPSNASTMFNYNLDKFIYNNPKYEKIEIEKGLHSLRHMYGVVWADIAHYLDEILRRDAIKSNTKIPNTIEMIKVIVSKKMGIDSNAIDIYFNRSEYSRNQMEILMNRFGDNMMNIYQFAKDYQKNKIELEEDND